MLGLSGVADVDDAAESPKQAAPSQPSPGAPASFPPLPPPVNRTIRVDTALAMAIGRNGEKLAMLVSHLDWLLKLADSGVDHDGHHWVWKKHEELRTEVFMDGISLRQVKRIVDRGREIGIIVTFNPRNHQPLHYRLDYAVISRLFESAAVDIPAWVEPQATTGIQLDQFAEADIRAALENSPDHIEPSDINVSEPSDIYVTSPSDVYVTSPSDIYVTSLHTEEDLQTIHTDYKLARSPEEQNPEDSTQSPRGPSSPTEFIMELSERLSVQSSARELNALRKIERDRLAEREGTLIDPGWASDIDRTMREKWRGIDRPVGVAVYVLRDLIEQERAGDLDMSEPPDWIPRPPTEEELAERQASHEDAMARLIRMQQEHTEQEERAKREKQEAEAAAEVERIERERQKAEVAAEAERIERERQGAEAERIRQAQVRQLAERLERAPERRSKLARYFGAEESDVAAWESALDLMLQDLELSEVLRHPGLIEVFEAMGLGLEGGGVYRLAFASNLKQQALLRPPGSEIVRTVVIEVLRRIGIDAASVRPVIPSRLGWERSLDQGV